MAKKRREGLLEAVETCSRRGGNREPSGPAVDPMQEERLSGRDDVLSGGKRDFRGQCPGAAAIYSGRVRGDELGPLRGYRRGKS